MPFKPLPETENNVDPSTKPNSNRRTLSAAAETEDEVQRRLLLDVVVGERAAVLELLAGEDEALLVGRDACRVGVGQGNIVLGGGGGRAES